MSKSNKGRGARHTVSFALVLSVEEDICSYISRIRTETVQNKGVQTFDNTSCMPYDVHLQAVGKRWGDHRLQRRWQCL